MRFGGVVRMTLMGTFRVSLVPFPFGDEQHRLHRSVPDPSGSRALRFLHFTVRCRCRLGITGSPSHHTFGALPCP